MAYFYTKDHEWARLEGQHAFCGISVYAVEQLGDVVYVELPEIGRSVKAGEAMAVVESAKAASDVYAPLSGTVIAVNTALAGKPELVNESAEGEGWFVQIQASDPAEQNALMDSDAYQALVKGL